MLSRVAECIYWMSRQVERAENLARFLEVTYEFTLDQPENLVNPWEALVRVTADEAYFKARYGQPTDANVGRFLAFDEGYSNSMLSSLRMARENARSVRESLSSEVFEQVNEFYHRVQDAAAQESLQSPNDFLNDVRLLAIQWSGVLDSTMPQDDGWHFFNIGRMLERADKTSRILDVKYFNQLPVVSDVGTAVDDLQWAALLKAISGIEAYRRKYRVLRIPDVVRFFLFDETFPRSVIHCVQSAFWSVRKIHESADLPPGDTHARLKTLCHRLAHTSAEEVIAGNMHGAIDRLQTELNQLGDAISLDFFHRDMAEARSSVSAS